MKFILSISNGFASLYKHEYGFLLWRDDTGSERKTMLEWTIDESTAKLYNYQDNTKSWKEGDVTMRFKSKEDVITAAKRMCFILGFKYRNEKPYLEYNGEVLWKYGNVTTR